MEILLGKLILLSSFKARDLEKPGEVTRTFNPSTRKAEVEVSSKLNLVYTESSNTARATYGDPVSKIKIQKNRQGKHEDLSLTPKPK